MQAVRGGAPQATVKAGPERLAVRGPLFLSARLACRPLHGGLDQLYEHVAQVVLPPGVQRLRVCPEPTLMRCTQTATKSTSMRLWTARLHLENAPQNSRDGLWPDGTTINSDRSTAQSCPSQGAKRKPNNKHEPSSAACCCAGMGSILQQCRQCHLLRLPADHHAITKVGWSTWVADANM